MRTRDSKETGAGGASPAAPRREIPADGAYADMTDSSLLALVLRDGHLGERAEELALAVIEMAGGLTRLPECSAQELRAVDGIGPMRASAILAALELGRRSLSGIPQGERLASSEEVYNAFRPSMISERVELFCCALLDAKLRLIRREVISRGTLTASIVHPRDAYRPAVRGAASGVVFAHNHPSGDPLPSDEDRRITGRLEEVGRILGIPMLDHVIVGSDGSYYSFADAGMLEPQSTGYRGMVLR